MSANINLLGKRFIKFSIVGAVGMVIGLGTLYIFVEFANLGYYLSWFLATILNTLSNYIGNSFFTWREVKTKSQKEETKRLILYYILTFLALGINYLTYYILLKMQVYYIYAALAGVVVATGLNFTFNNWIIWKEKSK